MPRKHYLDMVLDSAIIAALTLGGSFPASALISAYLGTDQDARRTALLGALLALFNAFNVFIIQLAIHRGLAKKENNF